MRITWWIADRITVGSSADNGILEWKSSLGSTFLQAKFVQKKRIFEKNSGMCYYLAVVKDSWILF